MMGPEACPCGSGAPYADCCGPLHDGLPAPTAVRLMCARYSAYALGRADYLARTWHPSTRPVPLVLDDGLRWRRLQIVDTARGEEGDSAGIVEFRAAYRGPDGHGVLHERSRFERIAGAWVYRDGELLDE